MWSHRASSTVEEVETQLAEVEPHDHHMTDRSAVITIFYVEAEHEDHVGQAAAVFCERLDLPDASDELYIVAVEIIYTLEEVGSALLASH